MKGCLTTKGASQQLNDCDRANPLTILLETILPAYETDMQEVIEGTIKIAQDRNEEVGVEDGFELYRELVEIRRVHQDALPEYAKLVTNLKKKKSNGDTDAIAELFSSIAFRSRSMLRMSSPTSSGDGFG